MPAVTAPPASILATLPDTLLHTPLPVASVSVVPPPVQPLSVPPIAAGDGLTDMLTPLVVVQLLAVTLTLYTFVPLAVGVMVGDAQAAQERPVAPDMPVHA